MKQILEYVQLRLRESQQNVVLTHYSVAHVYHLPDTTFVRKRDIIYVSIKLPLTTKDTTFEVYRISTVGIPLQSNGTSYTRIDSLSKYVVMNKDRTLHFDIDGLPSRPTINSNLIRLSRAMFDISHETCALALFQNDIQLVSKLCEVNMYPNGIPITEAILPMGGGKYLISTNGQPWTKSCPLLTPQSIDMYRKQFLRH